MLMTINFKTTNAPTTCPLCGRSLWAKELIVIDIEEDKFISVCQNCYSHINTCATCDHNYQCGLRNDKTEPPFIVQTIPQNNMVFQTKIKNPKLIEKYCSSCKCAQPITPTNGDIPCLFEEGGANCPNYTMLSMLRQ